MFDFIVIVSVIAFAVGSFFAIKGKGMFTSPATKVGACLCTAGILAIGLHYNGVL